MDDVRTGALRGLPRFRGLAVLLVCASVLTGVCRGETVKGVLYHETGGQGANPVRAILFAVRDRVYYLEYSPRYLKPRISTNACWEPGAIWTVWVTELRDRGELTDAECAGVLDTSVHAPFVLIRDYLNSLAKNPGTSLAVISSAGWRSSGAFSQYEAVAKKLDLSYYPTGACLGLRERETPNKVQIETSDCRIRLEGKPVVLTFSIVRDVPAEPSWKVSQVVIR